MIAVTQDLLTLDNGLDSSALFNTEMTHIGIALEQVKGLPPPNIKVLIIIANSR